MISSGPKSICLRDGAQLILVATRGHSWGEALVATRGHSWGEAEQSLERC